MENKEEIIINDTTIIKPKRVYKPLTEAQKEMKKIAMRRFYEKKNQILNTLNVNGFQVKHIIINIEKKY